MATTAAAFSPDRSGFRAVSLAARKPTLYYLMMDGAVSSYAVIPLSVQQENDVYIVGDPDAGEFYQFPEEGVRILDWLGAGVPVPEIKSRLSVDNVDVDQFLGQLTEIGFIHPEGQRPSPLVSRFNFSVSRRFARMVFSPPVAICYLAVIFYAVFLVIQEPRLRLNLDAFYIENNKTALLFALMSLSLVQTVLHELGHMLAAARHGVRSKYGLGNRMWTIVAESDLTGLLALPKSQRYFPMFAGLLVDALSAALLTIALRTLLRHDAGPFAIQVVQAMVLEIVMGMTWQFNVFVKTDIYYVICNYFSEPDLDAAANVYLRGLLYRATLGRFGRRPGPTPERLAVLRLFSLIWLLGRVLSLYFLFAVFLPTMGRYLGSAVKVLDGSSESVWAACDTILYVTITLTIIGSGMYIWLKSKYRRGG